METNNHALQSGTILHGQSAYTIERVLGSGGFGITYLASTTFMHGNIAIKGFVAIKEHFLSDYCERTPGQTQIMVANTAKIQQLVANARKDFLAEARRLSKLGVRHNNIVRVNEVFEANGTAYFVMEYLDGMSLQDYIKKNGPLDEAAMRAILAPIIDAVAFLHRNRFTHLDIKPANIMLTKAPDGTMRPVLIDFGLSKHYDESGNATSTINTCGASDGYAPVEQYQGIRTFSPTADVYALGATMLACLTGSRPSASANWLPGEPEATIATLSASNDLKAVLTRSLSSAAHDRYADAGALQTALGGGKGGGTYVLPKDDTKILPTGKPSSKKWLGVGAALLILALAGLGFVIFGNNSGAGGFEESLPADTVGVEQDIVAVEPAPVEAQAEEVADSAAAQVEAPAVMSDAWWNERRTPHNLDLAVNRGGYQYYLSEADYSSLTASQKSSIDKVGVVVIGNDDNGTMQRFILALNDLTSEPMGWNDAMRRYGNYLPTKDQAMGWAIRKNEVNRAIARFDGNRPGENEVYWTKTKNYDNYSWAVGMDAGGMYSNYIPNKWRVRAVAMIGGTPGKTHNGALVNPADYAPTVSPTADEPNHPHPTTQTAAPAPVNHAVMSDGWWNNRRTPHNLDLAVNRGGIQYYLSEADYSNLNASQKSSLDKVGVVVIGNDESFILALRNLNPEMLDWLQAKVQYGPYLPTKAQGEALVAQKDAIKTAVTSFGGAWPSNSAIWTKDDGYVHSNRITYNKAWAVFMDRGIVQRLDKTGFCFVRRVFPLAD